MKDKNAAVLWTGGKDSFMALCEARAKGYEIKSLITFISSEKEFLAHPLHFIKYQAASLGLPHHAIMVREPFSDSYKNAIRSLKEKHSIEILITGDIAEVDGLPNWIRQCAAGTGVDVYTPLWGSDRVVLLEKIVKEGLKVIFSCVKKHYFSDEWLGTELDAVSLERLRAMNSKVGVDMCGEGGEYHTLVLDGPLFRRGIQITNSSKRERDSLAYIHIEGMRM